MAHPIQDDSLLNGRYRLRLPGDMAGRVVRAAQALRQTPGEALSPAGKWVLDQARFLLDTAEALRREAAPLPRLPGREGAPRALQTARALAGSGEEISAQGVLRAFRQAGPWTQDELSALPQALGCALLEALCPLLEDCRQEPDRASRAADWALAFARQEKDALPLEPLLLAQTLRALDDLEDAEALARADEALAPLGGGEEAQRQAERLMTEAGQRAGRLLEGLKTVRRLPYDRLTEALSPVGAVLRQESTYRQMDGPSRAYYRQCACRLAKRWKLPEAACAQAALDAAAGKEGPQGQAGYYLMERPDLLKAFLRNKPASGFAYRHRQGLFALPLYLGAGAAFLAGMALGLPWPVWPLMALCASEPLRLVYFSILRRLFPPRLLPRLQRKKLLPGERTLIVLPALLTGRKQALGLVRQLAALRKAHPDPLLEMMLLCDFQDGPEETQPQDEELLLAVRLGVEALNRQAGGGFLYLQRARAWSAGEGRYLGRERKRGALEALNQLIEAGEAPQDRFLYMSQPGSFLRGRYAFVITLDADTFLPAGAAHALVGAMQHPLQRGRVGVIQPRMAVSPDLARTRIQRFLGGPGGADPYCLAAQDVYQDVLGRGSFVGKGIYAPGPWLRALDGRMPAGRLLSHDLIEGETAGSALAEDIVLFDGHPASLAGWQKRLHRWTRGDWQLLPFLWDRRLSFLSRHKIWDNLRRSLVPAAQLALLFAGFGYSAPALWLLALPWPLRGMALRLALLPGKACTLLDGAVRALWRQFVSHRKLLSWVTAAQAEGSAALPPACVGANLLAGGGLLALTLPSLPGAALGALWLFGPVLIPWLNRPAQAPRPLTNAQKQALRGFARDTWKFFEETVKEATRFLPPDNWQLDPEKGPALRTSPTNVGLYLLSCCAARELGLLSPAELGERLDRAIASLEKLKKWRGHCYNWYSLETGLPLAPGFVSTVDSGNLTGCLLCCAQLCRAQGKALPPPYRTLPARLDALAQAADFGALYDENAHLFFIGFDTEAGRPTPGHYDLLASEASLTSFLAVMTGQVEKKHWACLGRGLAWAGGGPALLSWSGTMFEYLLPTLLLPALPGTLLGESARRAVRAQRQAAKEKPFGVSESAYYAFDPDLRYQYRAFGLPALAQSPETECRVTAPYASALALAFAPRAAAENLLWMARLGWKSPYGFYEAADDTGPALRLVKSHYAHHQGMILCALCNALTGDSLRRAFMALPSARAFSDLLWEPCPAHAPRRRPLPLETAASPVNPIPGRRPRPGLPLEAHALSGGGACWVLTAQGQGRLTCRGMEATRFFSQAGADSGPQFYLRDPETGLFTRPAAAGEALFEAGQVSFRAVWQGLSIQLRCCVDPLTGAAVTALELENPGLSDRDIEAVSFLEIAQGPLAADRAHANFRDLSVRVSPWQSQGLYARRLPRGPEEEGLPLIAHWAGGEGAVIRRQGDRTLFLGRLGTYARPAQLENPRETPCRVGDVGAPCLSLTLSLRVHGQGACRVWFVTLFPETVSVLPSLPLAPARLNRAFSLAAAQAQFTARRLRLDGPGLALCQQILGAALFWDQPHQLFPRPGSRQALWTWGVSGALPVLLCRVTPGGSQGPLKQLLLAHAWLRQQGVETDLLFLCPEEGAYLRPCRDRLARLLAAGPDREELNRAGGVHIAQGGEEMFDSLRALARLTFLDTQRLSAQWNALRRPFQAQAPSLSLPAALPPEGLSLFNGFGGFGPDGAYRVVAPAPVPWHQMVCGAQFGALLCETGILSSYAGNSLLGRLTRPCPDVYRGLPSEEIYLLDEGGAALPLTRGAAEWAPGMGTYTASFDGLSAETAVFAQGTGACGGRIVTLRAEGARRLTLCWLIRFSLGENGENTRCQPAGDGLLLAHAPDFPGCAWAALEGAAGKSVCGGFCPGPVLPQGLPGPGSAGLFALPFSLRPREARRFFLLLGAAPDLSAARRERDALLSQGPAQALRAQQAQWEKRLSRLTLFSLDPVEQVMLNRWLPYQVRAARLLARMGPYQPGGAIGFRDQLQDCLALLFTEPEAVRAHLLLCAAHQYREGDAQHWWHPPRTGVRTRISDDKLFLPFLTAQYVAVTGDESVLSAPAPYLLSPPLGPQEGDRYETPEVSDVQEPLLAHCVKALQSVALGPHGLPRMGAGDWNDGLNRVGGESVWLAFFYAWTLGLFAPLCPPDLKEAFRRLRLQILDSAEQAWTGQWYLRAWREDGAPLAGPDTDPPRIDLITQCFAWLGGAPKAHARTALMAAVEKLYDRAHGLVKLLDPPFAPEEQAGYIGGYLPGVRENGGQYTHAVPWLLLALCQAGERALAWEIGRALLPPLKTDTKEKALAYRAEPYVLCGDVYAGENPGRAGWSWYTGSAAWLYWVWLTELLGFEKRGNRARLRPLSGPGPGEFTLLYRFGSATYRFTAAADAPFPTLDGEKLKEGWVTLVDDGRDHEGRFRGAGS